MQQLRVVDASAYQRGLDWRQAAREGVGAGIVKRSEGTSGVDPAFNDHWKALKDAGLCCGAYHFSRWDYETNPAAEARHFLSLLPPLDEGTVLALDIEDSPQQIPPPDDLSHWALTWLAAVEIATQRNPLVYSDYAFAKAHLKDPRLGQYGLWVAAYAPENPGPFGPWHSVACWQRTNQAQVAGAVVDESVFYGDAAQLRAYGTPPAAPRGAPKPAGRGKAGPRFLITTAMMARGAPDLGAVDWPVQYVNKGATLEGTGRQTAHWVEVIAGGHPVWIWLANTRAV